MSLELALAMLRLAPWLVLWGLTDGPRSRSQRLPQAQNVVGAGFSHAAAGTLAGFMGSSKLTDGPLSRSQRLPQAQNVVGAGFSHAAAGALAGFLGFLS